MPNAQNIQGDLRVDSFLTNYSVQYMQDATNFVSRVASTMIPVNNQSDLYQIFDRGYFLRDEMEPRALGGAPVQVGYKLTSGTYNALEYALEHNIDDRQRANARNGLNLDQNATALLTSKDMIKRDRTWAQQFFKTGVWGLDVTGVSSSPSGNRFLQFDQASADPIGTFDLYKDVIAQSTGLEPNVIVLGSKVRRVLRTNADISDRIKYTRTGIVEDDIMASLFGVDRVISPRSIYNAADEGAADNFQFIVPDDGIWMGYIAPNAALNTPTAIATFNWTGLLGGAANEFGGVITRGREGRAYSDWFHIRAAWDMKPVATELGVFFNTAVA